MIVFDLHLCLHSGSLFKILNINNVKIILFLFIPNKNHKFTPESKSCKNKP